MAKSLEQIRRNGAERKQRWRERNPEAARERTRIDNERWLARDPANVRKVHDLARAQAAREGGYAPPPPEAECTPRTDHCQYCHKPMDPAKVIMDHNHKTGAFLAWACPSCNVRITDRIGPFGEPNYYPAA